MRRKTLGLIAVSALVLVAIAVAGAMALSPASTQSGARAGKELPYPSASQRMTLGVPLPVAREKVAGGREAFLEGIAHSQQAYADLAIPHKTVATAQLQGALSAMRRHDDENDDVRGRRWEEVGPFTLDVATEATQNAGLPTEWSGRQTAIEIDPKCNTRDCRIYIGAAGGGVWRTDDALDRNPRWKPLERGLPTTSIGDLAIDPHDKSGRTIYVGTGEPSGSSDSEAGLGLYKSTDRGQHWQLVPGSFAVAKDRGIGEVVIDPRNRNHIWLGTTVARHGSSGTNGGRFTPPGAPTIGLYESTDGGESFQLRFNLPQDAVNPNSPNGSDFFKGGVTDIEYDPADPTTFYFTMFDYGVFRASGNGATIQNIYAGAGPDPALVGIRYEVAAAKLSNGKTRLYVHDGRNEVDANQDFKAEDGSRVLRTDDARGAATFQMLTSTVDGTPGYSSMAICGAQCSYDMPIAVSPKDPDVVMIGGNTRYGELPPYFGADRSNGRNIMLSRNAGVLFTDMSGEPKDPDEQNHPDVQTLAFHPTNPNILFIGSDGGIVRTSGRFVNDSADCDEPSRNLSGVDLVDCRMWLSHIPTDLITMNSGLRTLQFQDLTPNPNDPLRDVIGGTQDNGTLGYSGGDTWLNFVSGDGGQAGIDSKASVDNDIHYHTYQAQQGDVNYRGTDPQWWSFIFDPMLFSAEASSFYTPFAADPVISKTAFHGSESVWRTQNAGGDKDFLENHCSPLGGPRSDRLNTGVDSGCGDFEMIGPNISAGVDTPADKGGPPGFAVSYVVAIERAKTNTGTLWATTRRGRVFITKNAQANDPAFQVTQPGGGGLNERQTDVLFTRLDTAAQPRRFPSGISVDPRDPTGNTAYISFSGYNAYTPGQPGHVFKVVFQPGPTPGTGTATWTDLSFDLGDLPITDVEVDAPTGDLYVSYDWGVLRLPAGGTSWVDASRGLPKVATYELSQANIPGTSKRVIYAATHGRGGFRLILGGGGGGDDDDDDD